MSISFSDSQTMYSLYGRNGSAGSLKLPKKVVAEDGATRFVDGLPVEFHCHGIGGTDFSDLANFDLNEVERLAREEQVWCIPTIYLPYSKFDAFLGLMKRYSERRADGLHQHLVGFAVEGPMLGSFGGTPEDGVWLPTYSQWEQLVSCGHLGLRYIVMSPDALLLQSPLAAQKTDNHPDVDWVIKACISHGVRPALGHFLRQDPIASAECIEKCIEAALSVGARRFRGDVVTDHLFNDMPLNFTHAWRTREQKKRRVQELAALDLDSWTLDNVAERCGIVPATIMRAAHEGILSACINFDGEHVDIEVAKRAIELIGTRSVITMTDRTDRAQLGSQSLSRTDHNTLYYQSKGIVAAGSQCIDRQIQNMHMAGLDDHTIWSLVCLNPARVLELPNWGDNRAYLTCIGHDSQRLYYDGSRWATPRDGSRWATPREAQEKAI